MPRVTLPAARFGRRPAAVLALVIALAGAAPAAAARWNGDLARKLDPALVSWVTSGVDTQTVWIGFRSSAARDPAGFARRLAAAAAALSPRSRARRERAHVWPLVDEHDVPVDPADLDLLRGIGLAPFAVSRWLDRAAVRATPERVAAVAQLDAVESITPVARSAPRPPEPRGPTIARAVEKGRARLAIASDPGLARAQLEQIGATALHDAGFTGAGVLVAILDEGFNFFDEHQALRGRVFPPGFQRDFVDGDTVVTDTTDLGGFAHGTWTLGCLAANLPGVYQGSAYGADVALARTENAASERPVEMLYWVQGAEWADSLGADIISSSVGYSSFDPPFPSYGPADFDGHTTDISRAAEIAASKGILIVNSVGNGGAGPPPRLVAPADVNGDSLIAVGAVDSFGNVASFSSRGPTSDGRIKPDLVARGQDTWLVSASGTPDAYVMLDGTSFSAPLVAGLAACVMQARPSLGPTEVIRALRETASAMCAPDDDQGWGIPNGPSAVAWNPGPPGRERPPTGYLEMAGAGANPFRSSRGTFRLVFGLGPKLGEVARARVRVFDATGRVVNTLFYGSLTCGIWQTVEWNGRDPQGRTSRPGIYFIHFDAEGRTRTLRVVLLD